MIWPLYSHHFSYHSLDKLELTATSSMYHSCSCLLHEFFFCCNLPLSPWCTWKIIPIHPFRFGFDVTTLASQHHPDSRPGAYLCSRFFPYALCLVPSLSLSLGTHVLVSFLFPCLFLPLDHNKIPWVHCRTPRALPCAWHRVRHQTYACWINGGMCDWIETIIIISTGQ